MDPIEFIAPGPLPARQSPNFLLNDINFCPDLIAHAEQCPFGVVESLTNPPKLLSIVCEPIYLLIAIPPEPLHAIPILPGILELEAQSLKPGGFLLDHSPQLRSRLLLLPFLPGHRLFALVHLQLEQRVLLGQVFLFLLKLVVVLQLAVAVHQS